MALTELSAALAASRPDSGLSWGIVSAVTTSGGAKRVTFDLFGAPSIDAASETTLQLDGTATLAAGDKILVGKVGAAAWVVIGKIERIP